MGFADRFGNRDNRHAVNQLGDQFPDDPAMSVFTALYEHGILPIDIVTEARELYEKAYWLAQHNDSDNQHTATLDHEHIVTGEESDSNTKIVRYWPLEGAERAREAFHEKLGSLTTCAETGDRPAFCKDIRELYPSVNPEEPDEGNVFTNAAAALIERKQQEPRLPKSRSR